MGKTKNSNRYDGWPVRSMDSFQKIMPYLMKSRCGSSIFLEERFDVSNLVNYLKEKNSILKDKLNDPEKFAREKYTYFSVFLSAICRTLAMYPHMNRFIAGNQIYQRKNIVLSFVAKKALNIEAPETTIKLNLERDETLDNIAEKLRRDISTVKNNKEDDTTDVLEVVTKLPKFLIRRLVSFLDWLDKHGKYPKEIYNIDPMHCSAFVANLGSIGLETIPIHHLYERGTCSVFIVLGKIHDDYTISKDSDIIKRSVIDVTFTLDERISNGFYYIKAIKYLKSLIENPELLEIPPKEVPRDE